MSASIARKTADGDAVTGASGQKGRFQFGQNGGVAIKVSNLTLDGKSYNVGKTTDQVNFTPDTDNGSSLYIRNNEAVVAVENGRVPSGQQMNFTVTIFRCSMTARLTIFRIKLRWRPI